MKSLINNENNYLNYYFGGYVEASHSIGINRDRQKQTKKNRKKERGQIQSQKRWKNIYRVRIRIWFKDKKIAELFAKKFGGYIMKEEKYKSKNKIKLYKNWCWECHQNEIPFFVDAIKPFVCGEVLTKELELIKKFRKLKENNLHKKSNRSKYALKK